MFARHGEAKITQVIIDAFYVELKSIVRSDCIIVGGGPAGLVAGYFLSKAGFNTVLLEQNAAPGGGAWSGGYMMNKLTVRAPADHLLAELGIRLQKADNGLFVQDAIYVCSGLIYKAKEAGLKILNLTYAEDIIMIDNKVKGIVANWSCIRYMPKSNQALDPICFESDVVIDATGHDAHLVRLLERRGLAKVKGEWPMDIVSSEDQVVEKTGEIFPGLYVVGMAVSSAFGIPRMGPTFGSMYLSGQRAAELILKHRH